MISEANHYTTFLKFARQYQDREIVDKKWNALLNFESELMRERGKLAKESELMRERGKLAKIHG